MALQVWRILDRMAGRASNVGVFRALLPAGLRSKVRPYLYSKSIRRLPDRQFMERVILPGLSGLQPTRVLFVGAERYTRHYANWFKSSEYWTMDIRPDVARFGSRGRHRTGSVVEIDHLFDAGFFDQVLLNGVFGWGVDDRGSQERTIRALRRVMASDGVLLVGWNDNRVEEPLELTSLQQYFVHIDVAGISARTRFDNSTHVYDFFRAK